MATRGFIGFCVDGEKEVIVYSHNDSYPTWLGHRISEWLQDVVGEIGLVKQKVREMIPAQGNPTPEAIEHLAQWTNLNVSSQSTNDWYCLLRETQGSPADILAAKYYEPASRFPLDSLSCEWGYMVDLDRNVLEVYRGFQTEPHDQGRFAKRPVSSKKYFPVKLIAELPFSEVDDMIDTMNRLEQVSQRTD